MTSLMQNLDNEEFGLRLEHMLGAGVPRSSPEFSALSKLLRSLSLEDLLRFVCVDLVGDTKGAFEALENKDPETALYCIAKAGENDWAFTNRYSLYDIP